MPSKFKNIPKHKNAANNQNAAQVQAQFKEGLALHQKGELAKAQELYEQVLKLQPRHFDALHLLGVIAAETKNPERAVELIGKAIEIKQNNAAAYNNYGNALRNLKQYEAAVRSYDKAIALKPDYVDAYKNRGNALRDLKQYDAALQNYDKAIALKPDNAEAYNNRGNVLQDLKQYEAALQCYDKAIALKPDYAGAYYNRGNALRKLKQHKAAVQSYDKSIALNPENADVHYNRGTALQDLKRYPEAIASYDKALAINRDDPFPGDRAHCSAHICEWKDLESIEAQIVGGVRSGRVPTSPFPFLAISDNAADQLSCARSYATAKFPAVTSTLDKSRRYQHDRIRIGYMSADFHEHPVSHLMAGLFEQHDRGKFEVSAISFGPDTQSELRSRLVSSFETFLDARTKSNEEVVSLLRKFEFDIVVDLMGFTGDFRLELLAHRPAPIQVNYLGYPGTMGLAYMDYIIADEFVIPRSEQHYYSEKVIYLPDCFQANDSKRKIGERTPTRAEAGLPEYGFVFCCFNNSYKIKPEVFDVWMRILKRVEHSVLWLLGDSETTISNLRREAANRGLEPGRLVFAKRIEPEDYLARYRLADLFLDTFPFNAGTTASDVLWAGLPLVTCAGEAFAARMAGSLLHAVGLPELVTHGLGDYEALAVRLATDEKLLSDVKEKLARNRLTKPLFDTDRFRRHIEAAYTEMWQVHQRGEEPRSFAVAAVAKREGGANSQALAGAHVNFKEALALHQKGELRKAQELYQEVLEAQPRHSAALHSLGLIALQAKNIERAVELIGRAIEINPNNAAAHTSLGNALQELKQHDAALQSYDKAIAVDPNRAGAYFGRGNALQALKQHEAALRSFDKAIALKPDYAEAYNNRGNALRDLSKYEAALQSYDKAIALKPDQAGAYFNRGNLLLGLKKHDAALHSFDKAIVLKPDHAGAFFSRGNVLQELKQHEAALHSFDKAIALKPEFAEAYNNRGNTLRELGKYEAAVENYDKTLAFMPDHGGTHFNRGIVLRDLKRYPEAIASYDKALSINPDHPYVAGDRAHCCQHICDWRDLERTEPHIVAGVRSGQLPTSPFPFLAISDNPADQLNCARSYVRDRYPPLSPTTEKSPAFRHTRIRVAYLSADIRDHAMATLMAELFEQHDRARFEVSAISFGSDRNSEMRSRLLRSFEHFIDVRAKSDAEVAKLLEDLEIDVAADLMGYTWKSRPGILALRPAPIQVNYLGYPGTMGADFIDYIIADEFVIPRGEQHHYSEKVVYLPDCFQANDSKRKIGERTPPRIEAGLPESGFVFCCFNNSYKIKPEVFDVWMRILKQVEHSVLWLLGESDTAMANLRREAQSRGVKPDRLVFAKRVKTEDYLARYRLANLFLDTLPFNAGTTASDVLWAGLPLVTCSGAAFAARMAGSLLHAVGLPELVTHSLEDYEALILKLATDQKQLREVNEKLARNRLAKPLFNTDRFRQHIEAAYTTMWEIHQRGEEPRNFTVVPID